MNATDTQQQVELLTTAEVAQLLNCKPRSIQNITGNTKGRYTGLPFIKTSLGRRFVKAAVHTWIAQRVAHRAVFAATRHAMALAAQHQQRPASEKYTIYGMIDTRLSDCFRAELFYIGCTTQTMVKRLAHHVKPTTSSRRAVKERIREILDAGMRPAMVILERTDDPARERVWIEYFIAQRMPLVNTVYHAASTGNGTYVYVHPLQAKAA